MSFVSGDCAHAVPMLIFFFFNDTATTEIYTLSLHDALPILSGGLLAQSRDLAGLPAGELTVPTHRKPTGAELADLRFAWADRKSTRLNSSHSQISYAVFCLKKKKIIRL